MPKLLKNILVLFTNGIQFGTNTFFELNIHKNHLGIKSFQEDNRIEAYYYYVNCGRFFGPKKKGMHCFA